MGKESRDSRLLAASGRGTIFTQFLTHKYTHLSNAFMNPKEVFKCIVLQCHIKVI